MCLLIPLQIKDPILLVTVKRGSTDLLHYKHYFFFSSDIHFWRVYKEAQQVLVGLDKHSNFFETISTSFSHLQCHFDQC